MIEFKTRTSTRSYDWI